MGEITTLRELYEARRLDEAWAEYERLRAEGPVSPGVHLLGGLAARLKGDLRGARAAFETGLSLNPQGAILGKLRMTLGAALVQIGETTAAIDTLEMFITEMDHYPELRPVACGSAHHNLALAYRCARRLEDAKLSYEIAVQEFRNEHMRDYLQQSLRNLAWLCCLMGDARRAEECLSEVDDLCATVEDRWHWRIGMAFLSLVAGDMEDALRRCDAIVGDGESVSPGIVSHAYWVAGKASASLGLLDEADNLASQATAWALREKEDTRRISDANDLKREIHKLQVQKQSAGA